MADRKFPDMFADPEDDPREGGPSLGDERATLLEYLRCERLTLEMKCSGLDAAGMAQRSVEPSTLSLLGLVRHMADVERCPRFCCTWWRSTRGTTVTPTCCASGSTAGPASSA